MNASLHHQLAPVSAWISSTIMETGAWSDQVMVCISDLLFFGAGMCLLGLDLFWSMCGEQVRNTVCEIFFGGMLASPYFKHV